jgi:hypothetical protein
VDCCVSYGLLGAVAEVSLDVAWFPVSCSSQLEDGFRCGLWGSMDRIWSAGSDV